MITYTIVVVYVKFVRSNRELLKGNKKMEPFKETTLFQLSYSGDKWETEGDHSSRLSIKINKN